MGGSTPWVELGVFNYDIYVMNVEEPGLTRVTWQADFDENANVVAAGGQNCLYPR